MREKKFTLFLGAQNVPEVLLLVTVFRDGVLSGLRLSSQAGAWGSCYSLCLRQKGRHAGANAHLPLISDHSSHSMVCLSTTVSVSIYFVNSHIRNLVISLSVSVSHTHTRVLLVSACSAYRRAGLYSGVAVVDSWSFVCMNAYLCACIVSLTCFSLAGMIVMSEIPFSASGPHSSTALHL